MTSLRLHMKDQEWAELHGYLIGDSRGCERGAFGWFQGRALGSFELQDWLKMEQAYLEQASPYHLALTDHARATVIKRAHDMKGVLVEFHSHPGSRPAQFSVSDWGGFKEWVPHVLWRLPGRPYIAVVVSDRSFDGVWWAHTIEEPSCEIALQTEGETFYPTGQSLKDDKRRGPYEPP